MSATLSEELVQCKKSRGPRSGGNLAPINGDNVETEGGQTPLREDFDEEADAVDALTKSDAMDAVEALSNEAAGLSIDEPSVAPATPGVTNGRVYGEKGRSRGLITRADLARECLLLNDSASMQELVASLCKRTMSMGQFTERVRALFGAVVLAEATRNLQATLARRQKRAEFIMENGGAKNFSGHEGQPELPAVATDDDEDDDDDSDGDDEEDCPATYRGGVKRWAASSPVGDDDQEAGPVPPARPAAFSAPSAGFATTPERSWSPPPAASLAAMLDPTLAADIARVLKATASSSAATGPTFAAGPTPVAGPPRPPMQLPASVLTASHMAAGVQPHLGYPAAPAFAPPLAAPGPPPAPPAGPLLTASGKPKPSATSCQACRASKTKCEAQPGRPCVRCARIGIACVPCAPSRRGLCHPNRVKAEREAATRAAAEAVAAAEAAEAAGGYFPAVTEAPAVELDELAAGLGSDGLAAVCGGAFGDAHSCMSFAAA